MLAISLETVDFYGCPLPRLLPRVKTKDRSLNGPFENMFSLRRQFEAGYCLFKTYTSRQNNESDSLLKQTCAK